MGIDVVIEHPEPITDKFQQSAATGQGPDIVLWAHDRFGEWGASGLLTPVQPSPDVKAGIFDFAWDGLTVDNKIWGRITSYNVCYTKLLRCIRSCKIESRSLIFLVEVAFSRAATRMASSSVARFKMKVSIP